MSASTVPHLVAMRKPIAYYATYCDRRGYAVRDAGGVCWFLNAEGGRRLLDADAPDLRMQQRCPLRRERSLLQGLRSGAYALRDFPDLASVRV